VTDTALLAAHIAACVTAGVVALEPLNVAAELTVLIFETVVADLH
jgi:hypothetical protein